MRIVTYTDAEAEMAELLFAEAWKKACEHPASYTPAQRDAIGTGHRAVIQNRKPRTAEEQARGERELGDDALARESAGKERTFP